MNYSNTRCVAILLLSLLGLISFTTTTYAATGASIPGFTYPLLHIPRIDVEGYGALAINLRLEDRVTKTFSISTAQPANPDLEPGATYSRQTGIVDIPLIRIGTLFYKAQLKSMAGKFVVTLLEPAGIAGQTSYTQMCAGCHGLDGLGGPVKVSLKNCGWCKDITSLTGYISANMPLGNPGLCKDACASDVAGFISTAFNVSNASQVASTLDAIELMPASQTLRKASLQLVSRLPTPAEIDMANTQGDAGLRTVLAGMMEEPAFYVRLSEIFNDKLLTNHYLYRNSGDGAVNLMGGFPNARWYDPGVGLRDAVFTSNRVATNDGIAREPLELINYVVKNNLPATEMLTANYFMVNGYSAKSYGITDVVFNNEWDPGEFRPARLQGIPHAGLLTSLVFLNRYPSTPTNRNRARARVVYDFFLNVNILGLDGARPDGGSVDIVSKVPTMENPNCVKCHSLLDPVASSFQDWNVRGKYAPPAKWYQDMFQAGFANQGLPPSQKKTALQWLATQLAADPRFDTAMVRIIYKGLTGADPLNTPDSSATAAETEAYLAESSMLDAAVNQYKANNRNLKTLITEILMSSYWRADGLKNQAFSVVHADTGAAIALSPELLHRKLNALFGFEWRGPLDSYSTNKNLDSSARLLEPKLSGNLWRHRFIRYHQTRDRPQRPDGKRAGTHGKRNGLLCGAE